MNENANLRSTELERSVGFKTGALAGKNSFCNNERTLLLSRVSGILLSDLLSFLRRCKQNFIILLLCLYKCISCNV